MAQSSMIYVLHQGTCKSPYAYDAEGTSAECVLDGYGIYTEASICVLSRPKVRSNAHISGTVTCFHHIRHNFDVEGVSTKVVKQSCHKHMPLVNVLKKVQQSMFWSKLMPPLVKRQFHFTAMSSAKHRCTMGHVNHNGLRDQRVQFAPNGLLMFVWECTSKIHVQP